jgi:hypothetical protein
MKRVLSNGLNVKDENRLANATQKLTTGTSSAYTFDDNIQPVMLAGVEENNTINTVDLITCIRDQNGVNRICVDNRGVALPTKTQSCVNAYYDLSTGNTNVINTSEASLPKDKTLYITTVIIENNALVSCEFVLDRNSKISKYNGTLISVTLLAQTSLVIPNLMIDVYTGDVITMNQLGGSAANGFCVQGFIQ